ncbi:MAG: NUDIX hydrolase [Calditrichaceae bacterium]|jgi:ADP-ribose pyrophosphatase YjhB (NUDIX family)
MIINQSAVIPYRYQSDKLEILLITSLKKKNWIIPKGFVEEGLTPQMSAAKEALEEAGIKGKVFPDAIGVYFQKKWGGDCRIETFAMQVENELDQWPEMDQRERKWLQAGKAVKQIYNRNLKKIVKKFMESMQV